MVERPEPADENWRSAPGVVNRQQLENGIAWCRSAKAATGASFATGKKRCTSLAKAPPKVGFAVDSPLEGARLGNV
jgi:hypothetical protein